MSKESSTKAVYENNPFFVATNGFELLFNKAKSVGILLAVLAAIGVLGSIPGRFIGPDEVSTPDNGPINVSGNLPPAEIWMAIALVMLVVAAFFIFIGIVLKGISDYTASQIARGKTTTLSEALRAVFDNFWSYTWVMLLVGIKTFLWSLLLVVPGIIMAVRYTLAGVSFFDTKAKGNASIKNSLALTRGAWFTTFGSHALLNVLTFGAIQPILEPGTNAVLYRQYSTYKEGEPKPKAHILSIIAALLPLLLIALFVAIVIAFAAGTAQNYNEVQPADFI